MSPGLLRQPGCFEGLLSAAVIVESHAPAFSQRPHRTIDTFDIDATLASPGMNAENGDDALTSLDELLRIPTPAFPAALPVGLPTKQSFQPPVLTRLRYVVVVDLDLRVESFKGRFQVAAYVRVVGTAHDLHVLLRHRPRSISLRRLSSCWHSEPGTAPKETWRLGRSQTPRPTPTARRLR